MLQMLFVLRCVAAEACLGVPSLSSLICAPCRQAWDLAVDICLSQLPTIIEEGTAFRVSLWKRKPCCPFSVCPPALRRSSRCPPGRSAAQTDSSGLRHQSERAGRGSVFLFEAAVNDRRHQPLKADSGGLLLTAADWRQQRWLFYLGPSSPPAVHRWRSSSRLSWGQSSSLRPVFSCTRSSSTLLEV